jgi:transcriptional regulator with XRE-family HTH domain
MTQAQLAKATGLHPDSILNWENGRVVPRPHFMRVLSETLGRPIPWLRASDLVEEW